jgi:hypothetical protein
MERIRDFRAAAEAPVNRLKRDLERHQKPGDPDEIPPLARSLEKLKARLSGLERRLWNPPETKGYPGESFVWFDT